MTSRDDDAAPLRELPLESIAFDSLRAGPKLLVFGAVHGNEPCGPIAIRSIVEEIRSGALPLTRGAATFVPVSNPKAYRQKTREGDRNLNRNLSPKPLPANYEDRVGNPLCALIARHDVLLDIHSFRGEGVPFVFFGPDDNDGAMEPFSQATAEAAFAACLGVELAINGWLDTYAKLVEKRARLPLAPLQPSEGFGTTEYMRFSGGYGVTLECGTHLDPAAPDLGERAIRRALAHLRMTDAAPPESSLTRVIRIDDVLLCEAEGDRIEGAWKTGDAVPAGTVVARRADGSAVTLDHDGFIVFPNPTAKLGEGLCYLGRAGERAGLTLRPTGPGSR